MIVRDIRASTTTSATQEINISEVNSFFSDRMVTKEKRI